MGASYISILHIFPDDKFFDGVSDFFDSLDGVINHYYFHTPEQNYEFRYIKHTEKVKVVSNFTEYCRLLIAPEIDVIYLHSMCDWNLFKHFGRDKKVIWWSWGYDIYNRPSPMCPALIPIELYKPLTAGLMDESDILKHASIKDKVKYFLQKIRHKHLRSKIIRRIDYFTPVLPVEYDLMKRNRCFRAQPFCIEFGPAPGKYPLLRQNPKPGNILIGNSFSPTNNHLDIFSIVKNIDLNPRKYVIPINYGSGYQISQQKLQLLSEMPRDTTFWLEEFMPQDQYARLNQSVTHAVFGHIRQQAVGNQRICICNGVKMYFYRDSINYLYYKSRGFHVFTIEDDLNEQSLLENLPKEKALHNYNLLVETSKDNHLKYQQALRQLV